MSHLTHRWLIRRDMPEVLALDKWEPDAWPEEVFLSHLRQRNTIGMVALNSSFIVGFVVYSLTRSTIYVHKLVAIDRGSINASIDQLKQKLTTGKRHTVEVMCIETGTRKAELLKAAGFTSQLKRNEFGALDGYHFTFTTNAKGIS